MTIVAHDEAGGTVLEVHDCFDPAEVDHIRDMLRELAPGSPVTVDFRAARLLHDSAIARLALELTETDRDVALLGLSEHHHRLLRYVGFITSKRGRSVIAHA